MSLGELEFVAIEIREMSPESREEGSRKNAEKSKSQPRPVSRIDARIVCLRCHGKARNSIF